MSGMKRQALGETIGGGKVPKLLDTGNGGDEVMPLDLRIRPEVQVSTSNHPLSEDTPSDQSPELSLSETTDDQGLLDRDTSRECAVLRRLSGDPLSIGMTGGQNYGTAIGQNSGTVIGKQEYIEDQRFKNICHASLQMINQDDITEYVSTFAERSALRRLKQFGSIFIKGRSGSGKSRLGRRLLTEMQRETQAQVETSMQAQQQAGRTPVVLTSPAQWDLIPKDQGKYIVLIDDIFGSSNLVQSHVDDWIRCFAIMWPSVESGRIFLVITSRSEISTHCENRLKNYSIMKRVLCIDEGIYTLSEREKIKMLKRICGNILSELELKLVSAKETKLGFPQCCKYFARNEKAQNKGVINFFEKPHDYILHDVSIVQESDSLGYLALVMVLMRNGCVSFKDLSDLNLMNQCQEYCRNLSQRITLADVKCKLESLCGGYLKKNKKII